MNRRLLVVLSTVAFGLGSVAIFTSCAKSAKTWNVDQGAVNVGGCLNMERLLTIMANFPDDTLGRRFTYDLSVKGDDGSNGEGLTLIARGNFKYEDRPVSQLTDFYAASQADCKSVALIDQEGRSESFKIKEGAQNTLTFANANKTYKVNLTDSTSMVIASDLPAVDPCNNEIGARVQKTDVFRWGGADVLKRQQETVTPAMLAAVARSTDRVPDGIASAMSSSNNEVTVSAGDLKALRDSEVRTDVLACFPPPPPAIDPPALPDEDAPAAAPSPSPAPRRH